MLASRPNPRSRLCPYFSFDRIQELPARAEGPRDPNSLEQQLVDTPSIRRLCGPLREGSEPTWSYKRAYFGDETLAKVLRNWPGLLDEVSKTVKDEEANRPVHLERGDEMLAETLSTCLQHLIATFPHQPRTEVCFDEERNHSSQL